MQRIQFIELEDLPGCPAVIRDAATDYLRLMLRVIRGYESAVPLLRDALRRTGRTRIVDLCSGGAGPWPVILPLLKAEQADLNVCLTDKYPNVRAYEQLVKELGSGLAFETGSVDARSAPRSLPGFRTIFTALHHFRPDEAQAILQDAVSAKEPIAVFEVTERSFRGVMATMTAPLFVLALTPFMRPFRWSRLFWTYLIPAVPFLALFDGVVSSLRSYSPAELEGLTKKLTGAAYEWESGTREGFGTPMTYLIGIPKED